MALFKIFVRKSQLEISDNRKIKESNFEMLGDIFLHWVAGFLSKYEIVSDK